MLTIINSTKDGDVKFIDIKYDESLMHKLKQVKAGTICDMNVVWDNGYELNGNIVSNTICASYKLIDIKETDIVYDKQIIKDIIQLYQIEQEIKESKL